MRIKRAIDIEFKDQKADHENDKNVMTKVGRMNKKKMKSLLGLT